MRVTIGERLGRLPKATLQGVPVPISDDVKYPDGVPEWVQPEKVIRLANLSSADTVPVEVTPPDEDLGPPRVRGEMVWLHKTAPTLVIEGRPGLSAEEHAAGRRR